MSRVYRTIMAGQRFGRLTALTEFYSATRAISWICVCDCGKHATVLKSSLIAEKTRSCGCLRRELVATAQRQRVMRHGMTHSPEYRTWSSMRSRCRNKNATGYERYGGAGIAICDRWMTFDGFYKDMGPRPLGTTLDRIDSSKGYSKDNCRWATRVVQNNNTRQNVLIEHEGQTKTVAEWARARGLKYQTLYRRLHSSGWAIEKALGVPTLPNTSSASERANHGKD